MNIIGCKYKMVSQREWDQTYAQAVFQITSQHMGRLDTLYMFTISQMKKVGQKIGNFLEMDYTSAQLAIISLHPKAKLAVGFKFLPEKAFIDESVESLSRGEWKMWQKQVPELCGKEFIPEIYAIPQKYIIPC